MIMTKAKEKNSAGDLLPGARAFNKQLAPAYLDHVCITSGFAPPPGSPVGEGMDAGFAYCELHCGAGVTSTLLAGSNPLGDFHAIDPREKSIEQGRALAKEGAVRNITFHHSGIEAVLEKTLPQFDYIAVNGIYSWVPQRERALVLTFVRKFLKQGGVVYVSYNARPGWNRLDPFRHLLREGTAAMRGDARARIAAAREIYRQLEGRARPASSRAALPRPRLRSSKRYRSMSSPPITPMNLPSRFTSPSSCPISRPSIACWPALPTWRNWCRC